MIKYVPITDKDMANGRRNNSGTELTEEEISLVKKEIQRIEADESLFVFNDPGHIKDSTCYNFDEDVVYVTKNVLPDEKYPSSHPRDTMSIGAVLSHEYYGHRTYRKEYLDDWKKGNTYHSIPLWQDECRASLTAAQIAPGLTDIDRRDLVLDAVYRAEEYGQRLEMTDFIKEAIYGYSTSERKLTGVIEQPHYVSEKSQNGDQGVGENQYTVSSMRRCSRNYYDIER